MHTTQPTASEKFDFYLVQGLGMAALLLGVYCLLWAGLLFGMQVLGWLRTAYWQELPLASLFVSENGQQWLHLYNQALQPLNAVPALGNKFSIADLAAASAGNLVGLQKIAAWFFDSSLTGWLIASSIVLLASSGLAKRSAEL